MKSSAIIHTSAIWPHRNYVRKSDKTVLSQIYLNKLWIPDVLIDIIKDYLYIDAKEVLRKYYMSSIHTSIRDLTCDSYHLVDTFGRRRQTVWSVGHLYRLKPEVQMQQIMCITCGEKCNSHPNMNGCCAMEWDGEDGTLELEVANGYTVSSSVDDYNDIDEDDRYDHWNPWAEYDPYRDLDDDDYDDDHDHDENEGLYDGYYRNSDDSEDRNAYSIRK